jgi:hypothetical protein
MDRTSVFAMLRSKTRPKFAAFCRRQLDYFSMKPLLIFLSLLLASCSGILLGESVPLVHPKTGERITCRAGYHPVPDSIQAASCDRYETLGFIRVENLTLEQNAQAFEPTVQRIERDITIRQETVKP